MYNQDKLELNLDTMTDAGQEVKILESLLRKGLIKEDGTLAEDLKPLLATAAKEAFDSGEGRAAAGALGFSHSNPEPLL